ncbi:MAG: hypothetical protein ACM32O_09350 [Clostridia bacterium]
MGISVRLALLVCGSLLLVVPMIVTGVYLAEMKWRNKGVVFRKLTHSWRQLIGTEMSDSWVRLLSAAGTPFGWGKLEWVSIQWGCGILLALLVLVYRLMNNSGPFPLFSFIILPAIGYLVPFMVLRWWRNLREEILSVDIARFINRYINLMENHVPPYQAMVKAARPTRMLKRYVPTLSDWNKDRFESLEQFKRRLGVDDGVILISNMRTIDQLTTEQMGLTMQRLEMTVDNRRMYRHRKKIKSLGIAYSVIVYPAFYIGLIVAMFPWYKLLTEILDKYLV